MDGGDVEDQSGGEEARLFGGNSGQKGRVSGLGMGWEATHS